MLNGKQLIPIGQTSNFCGPNEEGAAIQSPSDIIGFYALPISSKK